MSLKSRLLLGLCVLAVALMAVASFALSTTRRHILNEIDTRLSQVGRGRNPAVFTQQPIPTQVPTGASSIPSNPSGFPTNAPPLERDDDHERRSDLYEGIIYNKELTTIFKPNIGSSDDWSPPDISGLINSDSWPPKTHSLATIPSQNAKTRFRVYFDGGPTVYTMTAISLESTEATLRRLLVAETTGVLISLIVLGSVAWWVIRLGINPVKKMTSAASEIAAGNLGIRLDESNPQTEAGELARALNTMLGTIETSIQQQTRSEERLRRFVADASHELRTPVTTIRGYAELYESGGLRQEEHLTDALGRVRQESTRMSRLVEDMLSLARFDSQRPLSFGPVDVSNTVQALVADLQMSHPERHWDTTFESDTKIEADKDKLVQAVLNILNNAITHTPPQAQVRVTVLGDAEAVSVLVADDGPGMTEGESKQATERFYRANPSRSRESGGSGLGLSIVESVMLAHSGTLEINSTTGVGTTVTLIFPKSPVQATDDHSG